MALNEIKLETEQFGNGGGCESGECSDEAFEVPIKASKSHIRHKKRRKHKRKRKKSKSDSSDSFDYSIPTLDPYEIFVDNINDEQEFIVDDCVSMHSNEVQNTEDMEIVEEENVVSKELSYEEPKENGLKAISIEEKRDINSIIIKTSYVDYTGLDKVNNLNGVLEGLGFSTQTVEKLCEVLYNDNVSDEMNDVLDDEEDDYETQMMSEIPAVETAYNEREAFGYSPEHADSIVQPYELSNDTGLSTYASISQLSDVIDVNSIPVINSRDPRIVKDIKSSLTSKKLLKLPIPIVENQFNDSMSATESVPTTITSSPVLINNSNVQSNNSRDWESNVANTVKVHLKPYLHQSSISRDEYKSILKRAVYKIVSSGDKKLENEKISNFVNCYVAVTQKSRQSSNPS